MVRVKAANGVISGVFEFAPSPKPRQHWPCAGREKGQSMSGLWEMVEGMRIELTTF